MGRDGEEVKKAVIGKTRIGGEMGNRWGGKIGKDHDRERMGRKIRKIVMGKLVLVGNGKWGNRWEGKKGKDYELGGW